MNKPIGLTSHDVVVSVRKASGQRKVGHTGTLDPMATGVLLLCLGKATRVSKYLMSSTKTYQAAIRLGISTTTHDLEGEITQQREVHVGRQEIINALQQFAGHIIQVPPIYSAIKRGGKHLYELARKGIATEVPPREVDVYRIELTQWNPPVAHVEVECGPGTYIRALARDLGQALGCGAHLAALCRTQSGQFTVQDALSLERIKQAFAERTEAEILYPLDIAFCDLPKLNLSAELAYRLTMGQRIPDKGQNTLASRARAYAPDGRFVALVSRDRTTRAWCPRKVFLDPEDISLA